MKSKPKKKPATPSAGMMPLVRKAIAAGKSDEEILKLRRPGIPITPGVLRYAHRTTKKTAPAKKAAPAKVRPAGLP